MDEITLLIVTAAISALFSIIIAFVTTTLKLKQERGVEKAKENERIRIKYLYPLLVVAQDLLERITDIRRRRRNEKNRNEMMPWFRRIETDQRDNRSSFEYWANDEGYFAMSTLYITAVYFYYASKIRREFPFIELNPGDNVALLDHLSDVRISIGGKFGIWEALQDSLGSYLATEKEDKIKNYGEFCQLIIDRSECIRFNRLIDFYRDIDQKLEDQFENIESSLKALINFLNFNLNVKRTEFQITEQSLKELKKIKSIPKDMLVKLKNLQGLNYTNEIDFMNALVLTTSQEFTDDYKPSIFRYANKRKI
jgi:hypothetical protein